MNDVNNRALCIGKFDALHLGHRALVETAAQHGHPCMLRFSGMAEILGWPKRAPLLSHSERQRVLSHWSADIGHEIHCVDIPFADVRELQPAAFIAYLKKHLPFKAIITGANFFFGYQRSGTIETLRQLAQEQDYISETVTAIKAAGKIISSSRIREAVGDGYCTRVTKLLNRYYASDGVVVKGEGRGRQLGFPTANIQGIENLLPASGVYAAFIEFSDGSRRAAAINIGHLPSISDGRPLSVEAHMIDWSGDCYDQRLRIEWVQRIREEQKFNDLDALKKQIANDVRQVKEVLQ